MKIINDDFRKYYKREDGKKICVAYPSDVCNVISKTDPNDRKVCKYKLSSRPYRAFRELMIRLIYEHQNLLAFEKVYVSYNPGEKKYVIAFIMDKCETTISPSQYKKAIFGIIDCLSFLQDNGYLYGDIKIDNVVYHNGDAKLIDTELGIVKGKGKNSFFTQTYHDLAGYLSYVSDKDVLNFNPVSSCMFALGLLVIQMVTNIEDFSKQMIKVVIDGQEFLAPQIVVELELNMYERLESFYEKYSHLEEYHDLLTCLFGPASKRETKYSNLLKLDIFKEFHRAEGIIKHTIHKQTTKKELSDIEIKYVEDFTKEFPKTFSEEIKVLIEENYEIYEKMLAKYYNKNMYKSYIFYLYMSTCFLIQYFTYNYEYEHEDLNKKFFTFYIGNTSNVTEFLQYIMGDI